MLANKLITEYENSVKKFIKFSIELPDNSNSIKYPCIRCDCLDKVTIEELRDYLIIN